MSQEQRLIYVGMHDGVCAVSSRDGGATWQQGPVTRLPHAAARVAVSPVDPRRTWLAAYEAGVYRTDDGGATWTHVESYPSDYAHSVLADPSQADAVYVGSEPAALFRSEDRGSSWTECRGLQDVPESTNWGFHAPTRDSHIRDLVVSPGDASLLYAGIEVGGVVRSTDGGNSWQQLPGLDDDIHCLHLGTDQQQRVYAATASAPYRSSNGGDKWEKINDGLAPPLHSPHSRGARRRRPGAGDRIGERPSQGPPVLSLHRRRPILATGRGLGRRRGGRGHGGGLRVGSLFTQRCLRWHRRRRALPQRRSGRNLAATPRHPTVGRGGSAGCGLLI